MPLSTRARAGAHASAGGSTDDVDSPNSRTCCLTSWGQHGGIGCSSADLGMDCCFCGSGEEDGDAWSVKGAGPSYIDDGKKSA